MPETSDPHAALASKAIPERAAGARDLALAGTPDDIPMLVEFAQRDKSPAVRLGAAGAAADILSRFRVGRATKKLSAERRRELLGLFQGMDPGINSGLFSLLACIGLPEGFQRIAIGLRDPRGGVRMGAGVGLQRLLGSRASAGDKALEEQVVALLSDARMKPDALAEVARVCAGVGYRSARPAMEQLGLSGAHGETVAQALLTLEGHQEPLAGNWYSDGRDFGEVSATPAKAPALLVLTNGESVRVGGGALEAAEPPKRTRRLWLRRVGQPEAGPLFQWDQRTWFPAGEDELVAAVAGLVDLDSVSWAPVKRGPTKAVLAAAGVVADQLPDSGPGAYAQGMLQAWLRDPAAAAKALDAATHKRKTPPEAWFALAEALTGLGKTKKKAREHYETYLKKTKGKGAYAEKAKAVVG